MSNSVASCASCAATNPNRTTGPGIAVRCPSRIHVACVLGLEGTSSGRRTGFLTVLAVVTLATAAGLVLHALRRHSQQRGIPNLQFRMSVTIGNDAIATVGVLLQFFPILLVPVCI